MEEKNTKKKNGEINSRVRNNWFATEKSLLVRIMHDVTTHLELRMEKPVRNIILRRRLSHLNCLAKTLWRMTTFERGFQLVDTILQFYNFPFRFYFISFNLICDKFDFLFSVWSMNVGCWHAMKFTASISSFQYMICMNCTHHNEQRELE